MSTPKNPPQAPVRKPNNPENGRLEPLLHEVQVAKIFGLSQAWLQRKRWEGCGPAYVRHGRAIRYERAAIEAWIDTHRVVPERDASQ